MKNLLKDISIYAICHFIVDLISCVFVLGVASCYCSNDVEYIAEVIIYNFFAFAFQVPLGWIMDKFNIYKHVGIIGFLLILLCYICPIPVPILMSSIVGIGNALFHLEGGVNAYEYSRGKAFINGLFVAPGCLGIFLGTFFYKELAFSYVSIALAIVAIVLLALVQKNELKYIKGEKEKIKSSKNSTFKSMDIINISTLIGISIIVRSLGGSAIKYGWKDSNVLIIGLTFTLFIFLGKALGGLIGDKFGLKKTAIFSLIASCIFLMIGYSIPACAYVGILLFNIPMSITLILLENSNKKNIAMMVGTNTFFLFIGYLICLVPNVLNNYMVLISCIVLAIVSIFFAFRIYEKNMNNNEEIKDD